MPSRFFQKPTSSDLQIVLCLLFSAGQQAFRFGYWFYIEQRHNKSVQRKWQADATGFS